MNNDYTSPAKSCRLSESMLQKALKGENLLSPGELTLTIIRDFAHNFRIEESVDEPLRNFVLN